ncbi:MAG: hypothetical protein WDO17_14185 [Alphaproteobacteria bacterium]
MAKLCAFHVTGTSTPVCVNPMLVRYLEGSEKETRIGFDKDHALTVPLPLQQVRHALDAAMNAVT